MESQQRQIEQMVQFILNEARDKVLEIESQSMEDFNMEKLRVMQTMKDKTRRGLEKRRRQLATDTQVNASAALQRAKLQQQQAQRDVVESATGRARESLARLAADPSAYRELMTGLIVEAALMVLEDELKLRCVKRDADLVRSVLSTAASVYAQKIREQTFTDRHVTITLDNTYLDDEAVGGVVAVAKNGAITVDNTLNARLNITLEAHIPTIKKLLFSQ